MMLGISLAGKHIGPGHPCFIIAEAGVNHNGDMAMARQLVDAAVEAKADAVKFQTFHAEELASPQAALAPYQAGRKDAPASQYELLKSLELKAEQYAELKAYCDKKGILFLSTPFDEVSLELLRPLDLAAYKIPSGEIVNLPFLRRVAREGKPIVLSSGMATFGEIDRALAVLRISEVVLLHCVTAYPAPPESCNLSVLPLLQRTFDVPVGWSDHTERSAVAVAAAALGACVIEKHFTLDRNLPGPDHAASLEPGELTAMIRDIRNVEAALGVPVKASQPVEAEHMGVIRKSLCVKLPIPENSPLTEEALCFRRHGGAIGIEDLNDALGRKARRALASGEPIRWQDLV